MLWSPYTVEVQPDAPSRRLRAVRASRDGLPVGLQIVAGHYKDALVLALAGAYAEAHPL